MAINRYELITRHNPVLKDIDYKSPMSIGNGEFAFTADVTGLQTLYEEYKEHHAPLCTMSQQGWHSTPVSTERYGYTLSDLDMTEYDYAGRKVTYAADRKSGNEQVYDWLRQNPHRINLGRLGFEYQEGNILPEDLSEIRQMLQIYDGCLDSRFSLHGEPCRVQTCCHALSHTIAVKINSGLLADGRLKVRLSFPYGSADITASDWNSPGRHETLLMYDDGKKILLKRNMDHTVYYVTIQLDGEATVENIGKHEYRITINNSRQLSFSVTFYEEEIPDSQITCSKLRAASTEQTFKSSREGWKTFWNSGGIVDLHKSQDPRAAELERRIILSMYQSAIQTCGSLPPQETGLTCNSWHGKFHLEMYLWHLGYLPLWNRAELLERSLSWYLKRLPEAKANAARNGFKGAKWPKQTAYDGIDSPSPIATLLIWQQPHIIYMLELVYRNRERIEEQSSGDSEKIQTDSHDSRIEFLNKYWTLVKETADYMADQAFYNKDTNKYDLIPPVIPAQEVHDPKITLNSIFEVEYWRFTLNLAAAWAKRLGKEAESEEWVRVAENMAELPMKNGLYLAHEHCPATYEKFNRDHPMMLAVYGLIDSSRVDKKAMRRTLEKVIECWNYDTLWGWDFAMMAMTAVRLGLPEIAIELLLKNTPNNQYVTSGSNFQRLREDLPVYLPGNGSLLLAVAMMTAGYSGCSKTTPGFPDDGMWKAEFENINPFPY